MGLDFARIAERQIEEAMEEGLFDNLPGRGKPLELDDTPAHIRLLKNAGVLPDWVQLDQEIVRAQAECAQTWARLEKEYRRRRAKADAAPAGAVREKARRDFADWHARTREAYLRALKRVNSDIVKLSLIAPSILRAHIPYRMAEEQARFDAAFPPLPGVQGAAQVVSEDRESGTRLCAAALYRWGLGRMRRE